MATGLHGVTAMTVRMVMTALLWGLALSASAQTVRYIHADGLGSVVLVTDQNRNVLERREYEPYGLQLTPAIKDGPGYTGHVQDAATGLTYMQQRYYDPGIGRFLSLDPVEAYEDPVAFNRYWYANNNPYGFTDPDGRWASKDKVSPPPESTNLPTVPVTPEPQSQSQLATLGTVTVTATRESGRILPWVSPAVGAAVSAPFLYFFSPHPCGGQLCGEHVQTSGMGEARPQNAPPGTIGLDQAKGKYGWDKDKMHGIKDAATGGMAGGRTWVGVAPDGTVGINEDGQWSPQGTADELGQ